jgi:hypothetical protein
LAENFKTFYFSCWKIFVWKIKEIKEIGAEKLGKIKRQSIEFF